MMKQLLPPLHSSLPDDIAIKIASLLQVPDLCALCCCSRFWRDTCNSDCIWESLVRRRWPFLLTSISPTPVSKEWREFYINRHNVMAARATAVVNHVEQCSASNSLEVADYLKAIEDLRSLQLGFEDVRIFFFRPQLNVLLNLIGFHYCVTFLGISGENVVEALVNCKISERQVCVKWWKVGRWFYGFRMRDESHSRFVSLADLASKEDRVLGVLHRGAIHGVLRVQISVLDTKLASWEAESSEIQG